MSGGRKSRPSAKLSWLGFTRQKFRILRRTYVKDHQGDEEENVTVQDHGIRLLPEMDTDDLFLDNGQRKRTLVLDLDETLVHSSISDGGQCTTYVRPGAPDFLKELSSLFEIVIFTSSLPEYADRIIDNLLPSLHVQHRLYRDATVEIDDVYVKDLSRLNRDLAHTILVDNSAEAYLFQPKNAIPIKPFIGAMPDDTELPKLAAFLIALVDRDVPDVRAVLQSYYEDTVHSIKTMKKKKLCSSEARKLKPRRPRAARKSADVVEKPFRDLSLHAMQKLESVNLGEAEPTVLNYARAGKGRSKSMAVSGSSSRSTLEDDEKPERETAVTSMSVSATMTEDSPTTATPTLRRFTREDKGVMVYSLTPEEKPLSWSLLSRRTTRGSDSPNGEQRRDDSLLRRSIAHWAAQSRSHDVLLSSEDDILAENDVGKGYGPFACQIAGSPSASLLQSSLLHSSVTASRAKIGQELGDNVTPEKSVEDELDSSSFSVGQFSLREGQAELEAGYWLGPSRMERRRTSAIGVGSPLLTSSPLLKLTWENTSYFNMLQMMSPPPSLTKNMTAEAVESPSSEEENVERILLFEME